MKTQIIKKYKGFLPCEWEPTTEQIAVLERLIDFSKNENYKINPDYESVFIESVNNKLDLNKSVYKKILDQAFLENIKLNYFLKSKIRHLLDSSDSKGYRNFLNENGISTDSMTTVFTPVAKNITFMALAEIYKHDDKYIDVFSSMFSRFCFGLFPSECCYRFFSEDDNVSQDYYEYIEAKYPDMVDRSNALYLIDVDKELFDNGYQAGCNTVLNAVKKAFHSLNNHCDLIVRIPSISLDKQDIQWKLYADIILFAEKHSKEKIDRAYFKWEKIGKQTLDYIKCLNAYNAEFEYAFQGFVFKDCFVVEEKSEYSLVLVFEKNVRDERILNCPACRSYNIQGNSYPILNVRSWECENPLCPDRSKYNRGKRYAFMSLYRQKEMLNDENIIPSSSISKWHLDCQRSTSDRQVFDMSIRHYSCVGDTVYVFGRGKDIPEGIGRKIVRVKFETPKTDLLSNFKSSAYFYRYLQYNDKDIEDTTVWEKGDSKVIHGDSLDALRKMGDGTISCAVTSPPYYNAKSYSQWANIYCYLYDMYNINSEIYRVLKDGGVFLYNIFDYFDNENNIALSAMGNKRMILGAYMIDMFERIGFTVQGNIIWNKGEIQGNRSFNQGNLTPYYQAPLNCWEHILILSKGEVSSNYRELVSTIEDIKPVIKMVRGKNILGHDAPYPKEIPEILVKCMNDGDTILDPFLGSGTTCIVASRNGKKSIGIEKNDDYFELCKHLIGEDTYQMSF